VGRSCSSARRAPFDRLSAGASNTLQDQGSALRKSNGTLLLVVALSLARPVSAQDQAPPEGPAPSVDRPQWEPLGQLPVDQAGAGLRGYAPWSESAEIAEPAAGNFSIHTVAANNFYHEQTDGLLITQRYETHTIALGYRRGFKLGRFPRFELGGQLQLVESDSGFLNGFISHFEDLLVSLSGVQAAKNYLRSSVATEPPLGTVVTIQGRPVYTARGDGSGFGDFSIVAKALLRDGGGSSDGMRVAARVAANLSGKSQFTAGNFAGVGLSVDKKLSSWAAFHGDLRASLFADRVSQWNLPLKRGGIGFSAGSEMKLTRSTSANVQIDGSTTPYLPTGTTAFDKGYGDLTFGVGHRWAGGRVLTHVYLRENMNLPFRVRWNLDPDVSLGIKTTIRVGSR